MSNLIDKEVLLKEWDKLPVQKVDYVDCGDAYRTRPLVDLARVCNMIKDAPTVTEAEIRAKAITEFVEQIKARAYSKEYNVWGKDTMISIWESVIDEIAMELKGQ